jgi:hypothetical protein
VFSADRAELRLGIGPGGTQDFGSPAEEQRNIYQQRLIPITLSHAFNVSSVSMKKWNLQTVFFLFKKKESS